MSAVRRGWLSWCSVCGATCARRWQFPVRWAAARHRHEAGHLPVLVLAWRSRYPGVPPPFGWSHALLATRRGLMSLFTHDVARQLRSPVPGLQLHVVVLGVQLTFAAEDVAQFVAAYRPDGKPKFAAEEGGAGG